MATIKPNKTDSVEVIAHQAATHPCTIVGGDMDVRTKRAVSIFMFHGYVEAAADTNPGKFKVQIRPDAGDGAATEHWITIAEYVAKGTTPPTEALTAQEAVGVKVLAVVDEEPFVAEDLIYIQDTGVVADGEWAEVQEVVVNTSIDIVDGLTIQKEIGDVIWGDASKFVCGLDLNANETYRVVWSHEGAAGANGHVKALAITHDSDDVT